ncbi:MAG: hypothetical protein IK115_02010 [Lachnospiraceae bacterium]|nr:hypothetical protein [Lachnospiraceae bacterium]
MNKLRKEKKIQWWGLLLTLLYFLVHLFMIFRHESWRDEAYVWVLLRNGSFKDILRELPLVGHPGLWFFLLLPFARAGFPFAFAGIFSLIPMTVALWLLLSEEKLPAVFRLGVAASSVFLYFNPVICRPYGLSVLLCVLLMRFWRGRREKSLRYCAAAALLAQTHVVFAGFCGGLLLELWCCGKRQRRKCFGDSLVLLGGLILFVLQLWQWDKDNTTRPLDAASLGSYVTAEHIKEGLRSVFLYNRGAVAYLLLGLSLAVPVVSGIVFLKDKGASHRAFIPAACGMGWFLAIVCCIRPVEHEQMGICYLLFLFFLFAANLEDAGSWHNMAWRLALGLTLLFAVSTWAYTLRMCLRDLKGPYSGGKEAAEYMIKELPEGALLGLEEKQNSEVPLAYMSAARPDIRYRNAWKNESYTFFRWKHMEEPSPAKLLEAMKGQQAEGKSYLLTGNELPESGEYELIFQTSGDSVWYEEYYLYHITE